MVSSAEKKPKAKKKEISKQLKRLNSSAPPTAAKKSTKKGPKDNLSYILINKASEDFNDSSDFVIPQSKQKAIKNEKSSPELSNATSKEPKKKKRSQSCSEEAAPVVRTLARRRTRSNEQQFQEAERNRESVTDKSDLSKISSALPPPVKETPLSSKSLKGGSAESKKQILNTSRAKKVKAEPLEKDEKQKRASVKKPTKSELVKSSTESVSPADKDEQPKCKRTYKPRKKISMSPDVLSPSQKSTEVPNGKKVSKKNVDKNSAKSPKAQPSKKVAPKSSERDSIQSKCTPKKTLGKEKNASGQKDMSPLSPTATAKKLLTDKKERNKESPCQSSTVKCPTCKELIPEELLGRHILMCLKKKYEAKARVNHSGLSDQEQLYKDEVLARQIHDDINRETVSSKQLVDTEEINFCHLCLKDLTHMNSFWKMKHINNCFDDAEKKNASKQTKVTPVARQLILSCPMCGKQFKTGPMRRCHLKKCAQELSVSPDDALKLIAEQEKNFKESRPAATAAVAGPSSTSTRSVRNKTDKFPDEQMQVAMAMSSSLFAEQEKMNEALTETVKNINQGVNRELRKLKRSQKKAAVSTPLLLTISKEEQLMRNAQRLESIISQTAHVVNFSQPFPRSSLSLSCGDVYHLPEDSDNLSSTTSFWSRASLTATSLTEELFYVEALMPQIKTNAVIADSRLKPLSAVSGRGLDQDETVSPPSPPPNDSLVPSTQTAVLLAELAQLNDADELDDGENSDSMIQQTQGFYLSQVTTPPTKTQENEAVSRLLDDFSSLINNPQFSDVELLAADSLRVYAHRNLLSVRCPQILNLAVKTNNSWVIEMKDVSQMSLLAFVRYLYAGRLDFERNVTADLLELSRKFDLPQLASRCEKLLQVLIDEACYTPSVESVASDAHGPLAMYDIQLQHNENDDKKDDTDTNDFDELGINDQPSEELLPLFIASPPKISRDSALPISPKTSYQESQMPQRFMEFSPKRQDKIKVEIQISESTCSETNLKGVANGDSLDTNAEQIVSALTWQEERQDTELIPLVPGEIESEKLLTSFMGLLSGKSVSQGSDKDKNSDFCKRLSGLSGDSDLRVVPSEDWQSPSTSVLARTHDDENAEILTKECPGSPISVSRNVSNSGFDDSNELFSEPEDFEEESIAIKESGNNGKKFETKFVPIVESLNASNDSICFVSENQRNLPGISMSSTALHLADTVCENSLDEDIVSKCETFKALSPANQSSQIPNCTLSNVNTSFHMADTVLEPDKNITDSVNSPRFTHSGTRLRESVSQSSKMSPKDTHKFSPHSLSGRFDSASRNTRIDFDTDLEVKESPSGLSKSPRFSFPSLNRSKSDSGVIDMHENYFNDRSRYEQRRKRKSCDMEMTPLPKRSRRKTLHTNDVVCATADDGLNGNFAGSPLRKETGLESSFRNEKTLVAFGNQSDLVSEDFCSPSESIMIPSDLMEPPENLLNSQTKNSEERFEISDDDHRSHSDFENPLPNSSGNLETYSRLSEDDNFIEHTSDQFKRIDMSSEQDSDVETVSDSKNDKSINAKLVKSPNCLPDTSEGGRHKKKFTFKRTQLKNVTSPVVCPVRTVSPPVCCSSTKTDPSTPKYTSSLKRSSEDHAELSDTVESDCYYQSAVWNDFEDNGYIADFTALSSSSSPARQNTSPTEFMIANKLDCEESSRLVSPRTPEVTDKTAENESLNESFIYDFICSSSPIMSQAERSPDLSKDSQPSFSVPVADGRFDLDKSKTPLTLKKRVCRKEPTVPSPFTPMPTYGHMTTPELEQRVKKHGCRKMKRKKMVTLLEEIYHKTHQYETDSEMERSVMQVDVSSPQLDVSSPQLDDPHNVSLQTRSKAQDLFLRSHNEKSSASTHKNQSKKPGSKIFEKEMNPVAMDRIPTLTISPPSELINVDDDDGGGLVSDTGDAVGAYEESFMANDEDIPCSQTQASSDNLHDRLRALIQKNPEIYTKILFYEPIDFDQLKKKVSEAKIKCSAAKLLDFLDNQCITFAMNKEKQHHGTRKPRGSRR